MSVYKSYTLFYVMTVWGKIQKNFIKNLFFVSVCDYLNIFFFFKQNKGS